MARINALNVLLEQEGKDYLAEIYGQVIENVQKQCISQQLKNQALSGTPGAGTYEAKRFVNKTSNAYGTARSGHAGQAVTVAPVTVAVDTDKEIIVEAETKDVTLYGVDNLVEREAANAQKAMIRELERAFFVEAAIEGYAFTTVKTKVEEITEELIQSIETLQDPFVDGVERDMISVICTPALYGQLRTYFDAIQHDAASESIATFHGVRVFSSVYLPEGVDAIAMADGAIAQPVLPSVYQARQIELSNAIGFGVFFSYGTKAVAPDMVSVYGSIVTTTTTTGA